MNEPTEEQIKKFWEWCGFAISGTRYYLPGITLRYIVGQPEIDLNNLFKYAVPKLGKTLIGIDFIPPYRKQKEWLCNVELDKKPLKSYRAIGDTPALALFWAIYKVMEE